MVTVPLKLGSSGSLVIVPSKGGKPAELLTMITPAAPAWKATTALWTRAQMPRSTTRTVPAGHGCPPFAASSPATVQPTLIGSPSTPEPVGVETCWPVPGTTRRVYVAEGTVAPLASIASIGPPPPLLNTRCAPGNVGVVASIAATESTPFAVLGEPTM